MMLGARSSCVGEVGGHMPSRILHNHLKAKVERGENAFGVLMPWVALDLVELLGHVGFDWLLIDAEHGSIGRESCEALVRACNVVDMTPIVRIPDKSDATILSYLEAGALGIFVPHVNTADDARAVVAATQYGPDGTRGACSTSRMAHYGVTQSPSEYFAMANQQIIVIIQIEEIRAIDNLDEILAVDGVFGVSLGAGDLAITMGLPGQHTHPEVQKVVASAEARVLASGKVLCPFVAEADGVAAHRVAANGGKVVCVRVGSLVTSISRQFLADALAAPAGQPTPR